MSFQMLSASTVIDFGATVAALRASTGRRLTLAPPCADRPTVGHLSEDFSSQRADTDFLPFVAHELRNSLAVVRSAAQLLGAQSRNAAAVEATRVVIDRHVQQMAGLIDKLLAATRERSDRTHLVLAHIDLRAVVARAVQGLELTTRLRRQTLTVSSPSDPVWLVGDAARLEQVVVNLLSNASKFTDEGGEVRLSLQREDGGVVVRVVDTGIGIDAKLLPHVFDLFVRAPGASRHAAEGSGVGLAQVRALVNGHGGTVSATSGGTGTGSEFTVRLPLVPDAHVASDHLAIFCGSGMV